MTNNISVSQDKGSVFFACASWPGSRRWDWMPPVRLGQGAVVAHIFTSSIVASGAGAVE
jgi:hypothetical protein